MKKLLTGMMLVLTVSVINAASINWNITGSNSAVATDYLGQPYASTTYLILASGISSLTSTTQTEEDFLSALSSITLDSSVTSSNGKKPAVTGKVITSDSLTAGSPTDFGLLLVSEDEAGNGYFKVLTSTGTPYLTGATSDAQTTLRTAWNFGNAQWVQGYAAASPDPGPGGDDPTPGVPEPATGALALAGLALLFRRRRA